MLALPALLLFLGARFQDPAPPAAQEPGQEPTVEDIVRSYTAQGLKVQKGPSVV